MSKVIKDRTPIQYQAEQVSEKLTGVMEQIGLLTHEVFSLIDLANVLANMDHNNVDKKDGKWREADE
jgi:enamine deaminase RidA (YjgF/YER057c/UK114 family)